MIVPQFKFNRDMNDETLGGFLKKSVESSGFLNFFGGKKKNYLTTLLWPLL